MSKNLLLVCVLIGVFVLGLCQTAYYFPLLPDQVASHFDANGNPDRYTSKTTNAILWSCIQTGLVGMFLFIGFFGKRLQKSLVNMPNKDYWLATERKEATWNRMNSYLLVIGIGTELFLVAVNQMTILENLNQNGMDWFWLVFAIFMIGILSFVIWIQYQFRIPADSETADDQGE